MFDDRFAKAKLNVGDIQLQICHGGEGPPLLLVHGYPQNHVMWHKVAPRLSDQFHVVCADLRGYGDSDKPKTTADHYVYSKRVMAADLVTLMEVLGYRQFCVAGHDRGARVTHRMTLDFPERVQKACVMDIAPTYYMYKTTNQRFATAYYHWFFLIQPYPLPERLIGADPEYYLRTKLAHWSGPDAIFDERAMDEYVRCFSNQQTVHATCEDYRAAASIDMQHDEQDLEQKVECPLLVLWGDQGFVHSAYDVLATWRARANDVHGHCVHSGHFLPEENPQAVCQALLEFFV